MKGWNERGEGTLLLHVALRVSLSTAAHYSACSPSDPVSRQAWVQILNMYQPPSIFNQTHYWPTLLEGDATQDSKHKIITTTTTTHTQTKKWNITNNHHPACWINKITSNVFIFVINLISNDAFTFAFRFHFSFWSVAQNIIKMFDTSSLLCLWNVVLLLFSGICETFFLRLVWDLRCEWVCLDRQTHD